LPIRAVRGELQRLLPLSDLRTRRATSLFSANASSASLSSRPATPASFAWRPSRTSKQSNARRGVWACFSVTDFAEVVVKSEGYRLSGRVYQSLFLAMSLSGSQPLPPNTHSFRLTPSQPGICAKWLILCENGFSLGMPRESLTAPYVPGAGQLAPVSQTLR